LNKTVEAAKWNFPLMVICGSFSDIIFYATWEFRTFSFDSVASTMSFLICLSMIALCLWVFFKALSIVINIRRNLKRQRRRRPNQTDKWKDCQIFFSEYKDDSFLELAFMPVFLIRSTLFHFIVVILYNFPLTQVSLLTLLSILMLTYLFTKTPLKNRLEFIQLCLNEILVLLVNTCVMILAILDAKGIRALDVRETVGQIIIKVNVIFTALGIFFLGIQVLFYIPKFYKLIKKMKRKINTPKQTSKRSSHCLKVFPKESQERRIIRKIDSRARLGKFPKHLEIRTNEVFISGETKYPQNKPNPKIGRFLIRPSHMRKIKLPYNYSENNGLQESLNNERIQKILKHSDTIEQKENSTNSILKTFEVNSEE